MEAKDRRIILSIFLIFLLGLLIGLRFKDTVIGDLGLTLMGGSLPLILAFFFLLYSRRD